MHTHAHVHTKFRGSFTRRASSIIVAVVGGFLDFFLLVFFRLLVVFLLLVILFRLAISGAIRFLDRCFRCDHHGDVVFLDGGNDAFLDGLQVLLHHIEDVVQVDTDGRLMLMVFLVLVIWLV